MKPISRPSATRSSTVGSNHDAGVRLGVRPNPAESRQGDLSFFPYGMGTNGQLGPLSVGSLGTMQGTGKG